MRVREFETSDVDAVAQLLRRRWGADPSMQRIADQHGQHRASPVRWTAVATHGDRLIGAVSVRESKLHPARWELVITADAGDVATTTALYEVVRRRFPAQAFRARVREGDDALLDFLLRHGFTIAVRSRTSTVQPADETAKGRLREFAASTSTA